MDELPQQLPIPHIDNDHMRNNNANQLLLIQNLQHNTTPNCVTNRDENSGHRSSHSISSLSGATNNTNNTLRSTLSQVRDICNELDTEEHCEATHALVKKCIKQTIWHTCKFLTHTSIKGMKTEDRSNDNSLLNILLKYVRKQDINNIERLKFWTKYGWQVQKEINVMKTIVTKSIKDEIMAGKVNCCL